MSDKSPRGYYASHFARISKTIQVYGMLRYPKESLPYNTAQIMLRTTNEERGTVAGLAALSQDLEDKHPDGMFISTSQIHVWLTPSIGSITYGLSLRHHTRPMSSETYRLLANVINLRYTLTPVHCRSDSPLHPNSLPLERNATFFEYVVVDGKRHYASRTVGKSGSSFVHVTIPGSPSIEAYGEVLEIFRFDQDFRQIGCPSWFARLRWLKPWLGERQRLWDELYVFSTTLILAFYNTHDGIKRSRRGTALGTWRVSRFRHTAACSH